MRRIRASWAGQSLYIIVLISEYVIMNSSVNVSVNPSMNSLLPLTQTTLVIILVIDINYINIYYQNFYSKCIFNGGGSLRWAKFSLFFFVHFYQNILEKHQRIFFPTARGTSEQLKNILINHIKTK